jgi:hypothetical protein
VFTFIADGPNLSATFTHAGVAATMSVNAVDATYSDGECWLGGSVVLEDPTDVGTVLIDDFRARPI